MTSIWRSLRHACTLVVALAGLSRWGAAQQAGPNGVVWPQPKVVIRGGWLFTSTANNVIRNRGMLIVAGRLLAVDRAVTPAETAGARVIDLRDDQYVLPGIF